jgi:hypothetical protein
VIERHGDTALDFTWRHKSALSVATVLGTFLADPEAFLSGGRELIGKAAREVTQPLVDVAAAAAIRWMNIARSVAVVGLARAGAGPGGLGPARQADPPLRTRGVPSGSSRGGRSDRGGARGPRPVPRDRLPTRLRCAAPARHVFPGSRGRLARTRHGRPFAPPGARPRGDGCRHGAGPPGICRRRTGGGWPYFLDISHPEWDRRGRTGTRHGPGRAGGQAAATARPSKSPAG